MREELYQILGSLASSTASFYQATAAQPAWVAALVGDLDMLINQHLRLAMRHIYIPLVKSCPPVYRHAAPCPIPVYEAGRNEAGHKPYPNPKPVTPNLKPLITVLPICT